MVEKLGFLEDRRWSIGTSYPEYLGRKILDVFFL